jgi:hypothetical protein
MAEVTLGGFLVAIGGESLGTMVRWRRMVTEAIRPVVSGVKEPGAEGFGEFVRKAAEGLTLEAKLALVYAWQPGLEEREADLLELATDAELEAAFVALIEHAYPLARAARPLAPMNGATPLPGQSTAKSYG